MLQNVPLYNSDGKSLPNSVASSSQTRAGEQFVMWGLRREFSLEEGLRKFDTLELISEPNRNRKTRGSARGDSNPKTWIHSGSSYATFFRTRQTSIPQFV